MCSGLLQHLAERPKAVVGFAEAGFATLQGLLDHGAPYLLPLPAFLNQGLVGLDNQIPCLLFLISGRRLDGMGSD